MQIVDPMDVNKNALQELQKKFDSINLVDVGCARGALLKYTQGMFKSIHSIGIDPIDHYSERPNYTAYVQCAIDSLNSPNEPYVATFYVNQDDQASSLLKMNFDKITSELSDRDSKYYVPWANNLRVIEEKKVIVRTLKSILEEKLPSGTIHLLKIDAEGKDLDVVKSIGDQLSRVCFLSLECSSHTDSSLRIFNEGCHIRDVIPYMNDHGFEVFELFDAALDPKNLTQVSDIVFVNNSFVLG